MQLDECIRQIAELGHHSWRDVEVSDAEIRAQLSPRWPKLCDAGRFPTHHADYYLSVALAKGMPAALRIFEANLVPQMGIAIKSLRVPTGVLEEVAQLVRIDLLVGEPPGITSYLGTGDLAAWLRIIATRRALKLLQKAKREESLEEVLLAETWDPRRDPTLLYLKQKYAMELKSALQGAVASLEIAQRNLLRQHVVDGLSIDELARLHNVHRATCARRLSDARASLSKTTRRALALSIGGASELDSVLRLLNSRIDLSISRLLGRDEE